MTYTDQRKFHADFYKTQMKYLSKDSKHVSVDEAFLLYTDTFNQKTKGLGFQIFGRHTYTREGAAGDYAHDEPGKIGIGSEEFANFSPLLRANWSVAINDTWLLGGVNSVQEFHAASPITWANILDKTYIITVTGRELIGLALAGYQDHIDPKLGTIFEHSSVGTAQDLSLVTYDDEVSRLKDAMQVKTWFVSNSGFTIS